MVTANEGSLHENYARMLGVDEYILKPFALDRLMDKVQELLEKPYPSDSQASP
jgi:DNA-binding response OmpR family regulator